MSYRQWLFGLVSTCIAWAAAPTPVTTIALGPQPPFLSAQQMAVNPGTGRIYVLNGTTSPANPVSLGIAVVNAASATFTATLHPTLSAGMNLVAMREIRNAVKGYAVNPATNKVYVGYSGGAGGTLVAIDATTDTIVSSATISGGIANVAVNPTNNKLYVLQTTFPAQILVLDGTTLAQTAAVPGVEIGPMIVNPANNKVYAAVPSPSLGVAVIDGTTNSLIRTVGLPVDTYDLIVNPVTNNVYAKPNATQANPDFTVYEIDGSVDQLAATISSPFAPTLGFDANFSFANTVANRIYSRLAIDGATNAVTPGLPGFSYPFGSSAPLTCQFVQGLAVDFPLGNMYAGCDGDLVVADSSAGTIKALVPVNYVVDWTQIAVNPSNHAVYGLSSSSVAILDPVALTAKLVQLGSIAGGIASNPVTSQVYITDESSSAAVTVSGAANAITVRTFAQIGGMVNAAFQPEFPQTVAVNKSRNQYIVLGSQSGMVFDGASNAPLVPIRPQLSANTPLGYTFPSVNETTNKLYSTDTASIFVTDLTTGSAGLFVVPFLKPGDLCTVRGLAVNAAQNLVYATGVCQIASPVLWVFDGTTGATLQTVDLGASIPTGSNAGDIIFNPKSNKLYISNYGGSAPVTATAIPPATEVYNATAFTHLASIANVTGPMALDSVLNAIYAISNSLPAAGDGNTGAVIDGSTDTLSSTFPLGFTILAVQPTAIAVNEATAQVYYVNSTAGTVSVFQGNLPSPGTFTISGQISGSGAAGVAVSAIGGVTATAVTNAAGQYTLTGLAPGAYTVKPTTAGLFYSPASQSVNITTANITGVNFAALNMAVQVTGLALAPWTTVGPGVSTTATVTINQPAPAGGIVIAISSSNTKPAKVPSSVTVPAGSTAASFSVQGNSVGAVTTTAITAAYSGPLASQPSSASVTLTVSPSDSLKIQSATWSRSTQILSVTATSTNPQSILQLFLASTSQLLGTFTNQGNGSYSIQTPFTSGTPASVNVKSNLGGSTGQGVTIVP